MRLLETYQVQIVSGDGTVDHVTVETVEATGPLAAGELSVGEPLALSGQRPKALVRWIDENHVSHSVTLYECSPPPGTPAST